MHFTNSTAILHFLNFVTPDPDRAFEFLTNFNWQLYFIFIYILSKILLTFTMERMLKINIQLTF